MLAANKYPREYVDQCRRRIASQVAAYRTAVGVAGAKAGSPFETLEHEFFNNMVLMLDYLFVHRTRTLELKDGNPLNEVRVICNSITQNQGVMSKDNAIKLEPAKSVMGFQYGEEIKVKDADFQRLADAFFTELERKFM
jgi:hypothetical protein